jgi:hypothetical protein
VKEPGQKVLSLLLTAPDFLVCGLESGYFAGWNLANESFLPLQGHDCGIVAMMKFESFVISGDQKGGIKIWNLQNNWTQMVTVQPQMPSPVKCLTVIRPKDNYVILAGHENGLISSVVAN